MKHPAARLLSLALFTLLAGLAPADDEPARDTVLKFFEERIPEALVMLKYVQDNEPIDVYEERLDRLSELFIEYHGLAEEKGEPHAESFLQEVRLDFEIETLIHAWHALEEGDVRRNEIRQKLRGKLLQQVAVEIRRGEADIAELEAEVAEIRERIQDLKTRPEAMIDEQLAEEFGQGEADND